MSDRYGRKLPQCFGWIAGIVLGILLVVVLMVQSTTTNDNYSNTTTNTTPMNNNTTLWIGYVVANIFLGVQQVRIKQNRTPHTYIYIRTDEVTKKKPSILRTSVGILCCLRNHFLFLLFKIHMGVGSLSLISFEYTFYFRVCVGRRIS